MRLNRWYERILLKDRHRLSNEDIDDYLAYFSCAWHLRDWLEAYKANLKPKIEKLVKDSFEIQICRDVVTVTKHCEFNSKPMVDRDFSMHQEWNWINKKADLVFIFGDKRLELFEIARACYLRWQDFLLKEGLLKAEGENLSINEEFPFKKEQ